MTGYWEPTAPRGRLWCSSVGALPTAARRTRCTSDVITLVGGGGPLPDRVQSLLRRSSLGRAATKAMRVAQRSFGKDAALTCKYVGKESDKLNNTSKVQVSWHMVVGEFEKTHLVAVRYEYVCARGLPCPAELKQACCRRRLEELVQVSEAEARESCHVGTNLTCRSSCRDSLMYAYANIS